MKPSMVLAVAVATLLVWAGGAFGGMYGSSAQKTGGTDVHARSTLISVTAGNEIIGRTVTNRGGDRLGSVTELVRDASSGSFVYAIVKTTEMEGGDGKFLAVPFSALTEDFGADTMRLDVSKAWLRKAPSFDRDHRPDMAERSWAENIHRIYGQRPYWEKRSDTKLPEW